MKTKAVKATMAVAQQASEERAEVQDHEGAEAAAAVFVAGEALLKAMRAFRSAAASAGLGVVGGGAIDLDEDERAELIESLEEQAQERERIRAAKRAARAAEAEDAGEDEDEDEDEGGHTPVARKTSVKAKITKLPAKAGKTPAKAGKTPAKASASKPLPVPPGKGGKPGSKLTAQQRMNASLAKQASRRTARA